MNGTGLIAIILTLCLGAAAFAQETAEAGGIPPQPLNKALEQFAEQSGLQVIYVAELAEGKETHGARPNLSNRETLDQLLASTGLDYEFLNSKTVTVRAASEPRGDSEAGNGRMAGATQRPAMTMVQESTSQNQAPTRRQTTKHREPGESQKRLEEIIVTGTNIRGIAPESSPIRVFDRDDIAQSGAATMQDFIHVLPQNFGGGSNQNIAVLPNDRNSAFNETSASSINLRGLGSGSTLVLLNGRRLAPTSIVGDFVDISMIPASAIERVEILSDGASSIYGGDAVAGVANFILRDDYEGLEVSLRHGTVTEGDNNASRANLIGGSSWNSGNVLAVYEYFNSNDLGAEDRAFAEGAFLPYDLLPSQERHSALISVSHDMTADLRISADAVYSTRNAIQDRTSATTSSRRKAASETWNIGAGFDWRFAGDWDLRSSVNYSNLATDTRTTTTSLTQPRLDRVGDSNLFSVDFIASGPLFELSGGAVRLAAGAHYRKEDLQNLIVAGRGRDFAAKRDIYAVFAEALLPLVGIDNAKPGLKRLEFTVSGRFEDYSDFGSTENPKVGILWSPVDSLNFRGTYSRSFKPPPLGRIGEENFGQVFRSSLVNEIFGFTPGDPSIADVVVLHLGGSERNLRPETSEAYTVGFDYNYQADAHGFELSATYFDIEFADRLNETPVPGGGGSYNAPNIAFDSPELLPDGTVVFSPTADQIADVLNDIGDQLTNLDGSDPLDAEIINRASVVRNLSLTAVRGYDFNFDYSYSADFGQLRFGLDGTSLTMFEEQAARTTPVTDPLNTLFRPVDLKVRGLIGYSRGNRFLANVFLNYIDDYQTDNTPAAAKVESWTTLDCSFVYEMDERYGAFLENTRVGVSVLNIFDREPPAVPDAPDFGIFGYDPANASPLGRFVAIDLTKRF